MMKSSCMCDSKCKQGSRPYPPVASLDGTAVKNSVLHLCGIISGSLTSQTPI